METVNAEAVRNAVRQTYGAIASKDASPGCCGGGSACCGTAAQPSSRDLGYTDSDLSTAPEGSDLGLGCGNPQAIASLKAGERVLDLGSGAGFDAFLAARQVGPTGIVVGVDMTPEMVAKARTNAAKAAIGNVDFRLGEIERLPLADASVDVIMSNCVINLSPDKPAVFREAFRVLAPGGRLAISDIVAVAPLPPHLRHDLQAYTSCVSGAALHTDVETMLTEAGFRDVRIEVKDESRRLVAGWVPGTSAEDYVASALIQATKPGARASANQAGLETPAVVAPACCDSVLLSQCCDPEDKPTCCDSAAHAAGTCGCR